MQIIQNNKGVDTKAWIDGINIENDVFSMLRTVGKMPFIYKHIAMMPDAHVGIGSCIGSVIPTKGAVIPSAVGVDLGCGINAVKTTLTKDNLSKEALPLLRKELERLIPTGRTNNGGKGDRGAWGQIPKRVLSVWRENLENRLKAIIKKHKAIKTKHLNDVNHLGTLGGGNHFIEVCLDTNGNVWLMLHSGSRGVGNRIGQYFINLAKTVCSDGQQEEKKAIDDKHNAYFKSDSFQSLGSAEKKAKVKELKRVAKIEKDKLGVKLPNSDLAYFSEGTQYFKDYMEAVKWAQDFAFYNRELMLEQALLALENIAGSFKTEERVSCHHNYVDEEEHFGEKILVTRKGAIRAGLGDLGIIPGCLAKGTRILLTDGFYKNIEDIKVGDRVVSGDGTPTTVLEVFVRGKRDTLSYRNNNFHSLTKATPDHLHFIGDLSTVKKSYLKQGYVSSLSTPCTNGESKLKWSSLDKLDCFTFLFPRNVKFEMDESFYINELNRGSSYEVGYIFGFFLGDGSSFYSVKKGGQVSWSLGLNEEEQSNKLVNCLEWMGFTAKKYYQKNIILIVVHSVVFAKFLRGFNKKQDKALPKCFLCSDKKYLQGLYDGLVDSDGHINNGSFKLTNTSTQIIELWGILTYLLYGYLPSISKREQSVGGLKECDLENCNSSFRSSALVNPSASVIDKHLIIKCLELNKSLSSEETYDLEVSHPEHSFVANNVIVHNSMGAKSYIVKGKGNEDSFCSASHGAGRKMSRSAAKKAFTIEDHEKATLGVECCKTASVLDETPGAYKDIDAVIEAEKDLVEPIYQLKQIICVKGIGE